MFHGPEWDCHGLPTEVQVEKLHGIRKGDLPPEKFRELCIKLTEENIAHMREEMKSLGFSIDWSTEYRTMDPTYFGKTQLSFVLLYKKGLIYRGEHPVNWCPRCETAIADAEVEHEEREAMLSYINFKLHGEDEFLTVATTRPEYLPACVVVAVHPDDERYRRHIGKRVEVPPFGQVVEVISDPEVDPKFGTGVVMVCTFGDRADVRWVKRHKLPVIKLIDDRGLMGEAAGKYAGLTISDCRREIIEDLKRSGLLVKQEKLQQSVGICWRCDTPIEILSKPQWFMRVLDLKEKAIDGARRVRWVPEHMLTRMLDWIVSMDWDWVISRQRVFATPIPAWYCSSCGEPIVAEEWQLPIVPAEGKPPVERCPRCGSSEFVPERDVLDTWMDSSITIAVHAGWPDLDRRTFPADLQPNGTDIIRTWDYYLLVRHLALLGEVPYRTVLINGMVVGEDGRKMSKSLGNYIDTSTARGRYGVDALRQWAAIGASTGSDVPFNWKDVEFGYRFMRKLWNAARFAGPHLKGFEISKVKPDQLKFRPPDRWILSRLNRLIKQVTHWLEDFQFNHALNAIQTFTWHELCDMYIEEVKHRLYGGDPSAEAARYTLYQAILTITKLLSPFTPHFSEEIYQIYFAKDYPHPSVHLSSWPEADERWIDDPAEMVGKIANSVIGALRQHKSLRGMALSEEIRSVEIYAKEEVAEQLRLVSDDIAGTMHVRKLTIKVGKPRLAERLLAVEPVMAKLGPRLRGDVKLVVQALRKADPRKLEKQLAKGEISVTIGKRKFKLSADEVKPIKRIERKGIEIEVLSVREPELTILVKK